ncbi:YihY/virulence factor BrkB family protein [Acidobacteria bacterium AB60]|nr:YihY/virulence factor BrkB family protein [Acidobacteria bacterium AB60]
MNPTPPPALQATVRPPPRHPNPRACQPLRRPAVDLKRLAFLFRRSFEDWNQHNASRLGAALAFYTILSISPLVILTVSIISLLYSQSDAKAHLLDQVQQLVGWQGRVSIQSILESGRHYKSGIFSTLAGFITLIVGASGVFQELRADLNLIWNVDPKSASGIRGMLKERVFSFGLVLAVGFVLLVSLVVSAALTAISQFFSHLLPIPPILLEIFNNLVSLVGIALLFAAILKYVPACTVEWRDVRVGASLTAILFVIGKALLGVYLGMSSTASSYGAAGSLVVLVIWVYYSAQIFYYGAEFTHVHGLHNRGKLEPAASSPLNKAA